MKIRFNVLDYKYYIIVLIINSDYLSLDSSVEYDIMNFFIIYKIYIQYHMFQFNQLNLSMDNYCTLLKVTICILFLKH